MISDLEKLYMDNINKYNIDKSNANLLIDLIYKLDKEYTYEFLNDLKEYSKKESNVDDEILRLRKIVNILENRLANRDKLSCDIEKLSLNITLDDVPNLNKLAAFRKRLGVLLELSDLISGLSFSNKDDVIYKLKNTKEYRDILLEFNIITNDEDIKIDNYINNLVGDGSNNVIISSKLKLLSDYYDSLDSFNNLCIPNMGLEKNDESLVIDNNSLFKN